MVLLIAFGSALACVGVCALLMYYHNKKASERTVAAPQPAAAAANAEAVAALSNGTTENCEVRRTAGSTMFQVRPLTPLDMTVPEPTQPLTVGSETPEACDICCEAPAEIVFLPCGHGGLCLGCAVAILTRSGHHCSNCRGPVKWVLRIESPERLLHGRYARAHVLKDIEKNEISVEARA